MIYRTVTIANGASLSAELLDIDGASIVGLIMPAAWTAANLTLQMSHDDSTYNNVYDEMGTEKTIVASASRYILLNPADFLGANSLKLRSGTSGTPVNQGADRSIIVVLYAP
ncbi:MAG: hypothetical protein HY864_00775 [Chloroflexi bacterium]|nr:hypothetical protein [Chloroflexota bacterium]